MIDVMFRRPTLVLTNKGDPTLHARSRSPSPHQPIPSPLDAETPSTTVLTAENQTHQEDTQEGGPSKDNENDDDDGFGDDFDDFEEGAGDAGDDDFGDFDDGFQEPEPVSVPVPIPAPEPAHDPLAHLVSSKEEYGFMSIGSQPQSSQILPLTPSKHLGTF